MGVKNLEQECVWHDWEGARSHHVLTGTSRGQSGRVAGDRGGARHVKVGAVDDCSVPNAGSKAVGMVRIIQVLFHLIFQGYEAVNISLLIMIDLRLLVMF